MERIRKILAPTDLSELSKVGVRYALQFAMMAGAEITVYHVVTSDEIEEYGPRVARTRGGRNTAAWTSPGEVPVGSGRIPESPFFGPQSIGQGP